MGIRTFYVRCIGGVARIRKRTASNTDLTVRRIGRTVTDHYLEINEVLDVLQSVGEVADIGLLKGIVGIVRVIVGKAQASKDLSDSIMELSGAILDHLRCIASVFTQYPAISQCLAPGQQPAKPFLTYIAQFKQHLRQMLHELEKAGKHRTFWRQSRRTAQLACLQRQFTQSRFDMLTHCALITTLNSLTLQPASANSVPNQTCVITGASGAGVLELEHVTDIAYQHDLLGSGFFRNTYVGEVKNIGTSLVKWVPRAKAEKYRKLVCGILKLKHPNLPQLVATLTCPQTLDLFLIFHSIGQDYMGMSMAMRIGCDFWPGGRFYSKMGHCWQGAEKYLSNHQLRISSAMVQDALIDGQGNLIFSLPECNASASSQVDAGLSDNLAQELEDDSASIVSEREIWAAVTMLRLSQVRRRIDYLATHEQAPADDTIPITQGSVLNVQPDIPVSHQQSSHERGPNGRRQSKMHACPQCTKQFPRSSGLEIHVTSFHGGSKPHACPVLGCNTAFAVRSNMIRHMKTHGAGGTATRHRRRLQAEHAEVQPTRLMLGYTERHTINDSRSPPPSMGLFPWLTFTPFIAAALSESTMPGTLLSWYQPAVELAPTVRR